MLKSPLMVAATVLPSPDPQVWTLICPDPTEVSTPAANSPGVQQEAKPREKSPLETGLL